MKNQHKNIIRFELPMTTPDIKYIDKSGANKTVFKLHPKKDIFCQAVLIWLSGFRFRSFGVSEVIENKNFQNRVIEYFLN